MQQYVELCTRIVLTSTTHCAEKHTTLCWKAQDSALKSSTASFRFLELHLIVASCLQAGTIMQATPKVRGAAPKTDASLTQPVLVSVCVKRPMWFHSIFRPKLNLQEEKRYDCDWRWKTEGCPGGQLPSFTFNRWPYLSACELLQVKSESTMEPLPKKRRDGEEKEKKARSFHK